MEMSEVGDWREPLPMDPPAIVREAAAAAASEHLEKMEEQTREALRREIDIESRLARVQELDGKYVRLDTRLQTMEGELKALKRATLRKHARVRRLLMAIAAAVIMATLSSIPQAREAAWEILRKVVKP